MITKNRRFTNSLPEFCSHVGGSFVPILALSLTALFGAAGLAMDFSMLNNQRSNMQQAADSAVIAAAGELRVANTKDDAIRAIAENYIRSNIVVDDEAFRIETEVRRSEGIVAIKLTNHWQPLFLQHFGNRVTPIIATSEAKIVNDPKQPLCMLGLDSALPGTVHLSKLAKVIANDCVVQSNSMDPGGFAAQNGALLASTTTVCSSGGYSLWSPAAIIPPPVTDCPPIADPLKNRSEPFVSECDFTRVEIVAETVTLNPGVYCDGLRISKKSRAYLNPGIYIIKGGELTVTDTSTIVGKGVGFFLTESAHFDFSLNSNVQLEAPASGEMAGLLFFEDRKFGQLHVISSNNARYLTGTIYLPNGTLQIDARKPIADLSAYTAIVAKRIRIKDGPILHLNTDYDATNVPNPIPLVGSNDGDGQIVLSR